MSQFVELRDYDASIHRDILDALVREDEPVIEICEDRAIAEMRCYLSKRYDCDRIFSTTGEERNQLVLMMVIDIAVYHIFCIHNPPETLAHAEGPVRTGRRVDEGGGSRGNFHRGGAAPAGGGTGRKLELPHREQPKKDKPLVIT